MLVEASDVEPGVRLLTLNRAPANAISADLLDALFEQCCIAREDRQVKAIIVTGAGKFFSAGLDLKEATSGQSRLRNLGSGDTDGLFALWTLPKPTIAMVNGHAIAGGAIIALACDFRITAKGSHKLGLNEVAIGLPFPIGAFEIARLALDNRQLRWAMLQAALHDTNRALELGFVEEVVEPDDLQKRCVSLARELGDVGRLAYAHTKAAMQSEAVARVRSETKEQRAAQAAVVTDPETSARLVAQVKSLTKSG